MGIRARAETPEKRGEIAFPATAVAREIARLSQELTAVRENSRRSAERVLEVEQILADFQARTFALEASLAEQSALLDDQTRRLDRADRIMAAMTDSLSWRITAPLRRLKLRR
jgi:hypothetical protein